MHFGLVRPEHDEICQKYKVKSFPKILVVKTSDPKPKEYQGELKYREIFNWLNVYSETFVAGGEKSASDKPWLLESIPELHRMSGDDICFKKEGSLCAILLLETEPKD